MTEIQIELLKKMKRYFIKENQMAFQQNEWKTPEASERYYYLTMGQRVAMESVFAILGISDEEGVYL